MLAEAACYQGDEERWHTLVHVARWTCSGPTPTRCWPAGPTPRWASAPSSTEDSIGAEEAIRRAVEYAGDAPTRELAWALAAQAHLVGATTGTPSPSTPRSVRSTLPDLPPTPIQKR